MKGKDLKNSILQMAVQGKLVPQDPNDESASVLLEHIREQRRQLIAEGKLKAPKGGESVIYRASDGSHYEKRVDAKGRVLSVECIEDEIPFEIPESWEWARLEDALINRDSERIPVSIAERERREKIYDYYGASGVIDKIDDFLFDKPLLLIGEDGANLVNRNTPIAFIASGQYWVNNHAHVLDGITTSYLEYVALFINSISLIPYITGTAQPKMNQQRMGRILLAIPPEGEQGRILSVIEDAAPHIEEYSALESAREQLDEELPDRLRKSVLQQAVQGRLAPQDPADEPASVLLGRIREQRRQLIAEGKLKAPKGGESVIYRASDGSYYEKRVDAKGREGEPVCIDDEIPFEIPDSWEWARLSTVFNLARGNGIKRTEVTDSGKPCVRYGELYTTYKTTILKPASFTNQSAYDKAQKLLDGEVIVTLTGENDIDIGRAVVNNTGEAIAYGGDLLALKGGYINGDFTMYSLNSPYMSLQRTSAASGNIIVHLSGGRIGNFLIAVPPKREQIRIVEQLDVLVRAFI